MFARLKSVCANADAQKLFGRLGGKSFLVVVWFAVTGYILASHRMLPESYAALATALSGFHVARAVMQDKYNDRNHNHN